MIVLFLESSNVQEKQNLNYLYNLTEEKSDRANFKSIALYENYSAACNEKMYFYMFTFNRKTIKFPACIFQRKDLCLLIML